MPEQTSTFPIEYGSETMEREEKTMVNKELQLRLKDNLIITSFDGEGLVFDADTRKIFWINEPAVFLLLRLHETNGDGVSLSSIKNLLEEQYFTDDKSRVANDFVSFINQLEELGLVSLQLSTNGMDGTKIKRSSSKTTRYYLKPMIKEEREILSIAGATIRAARMAAARSAAVSRATAACFRGFR